MEGKKRYLAPVSSKSVVQIIIDRLTGAIIEGELKPGDKIPTEPGTCRRTTSGKKLSKGSDTDSGSIWGVGDQKTRGHVCVQRIFHTDY